MTARVGLGIVAATLLTLSCAEAPTAPGSDDAVLPAFNNGVVALTTGSGHFLDFRFAEPELRTFSFTARMKADGSTTGQWQLNNRNFPVRVHGSVECLSISGNQAWFAGPTRQSDDPAQIGVIRAYRVIDNDEASGVADRISFAVPVGSAAAWCAAQPAVGTNPIESGNIQVH